MGTGHTGTALRSSQNWNPALTGEGKWSGHSCWSGMESYSRWNQAGQRSGQAWWHLSGLAVKQPSRSVRNGPFTQSKETPTGALHYTDRPGEGGPWKGSI